MIKNKLKEFLSQLKKFKVEKKRKERNNQRNDHKIFHSSLELIASDSDSDQAF